MTGISEKINKLNSIDQCDLNSVILTKNLMSNLRAAFTKFAVL